MNTRSRNRSGRPKPTLETPVPPYSEDEEEISILKDRKTEKDSESSNYYYPEEDVLGEDLPSPSLPIINRLSFSGNIDSTALLNQLRQRFKRKECKWSARANRYAKLNLMLQLLILLMQVVTLVMHDFQQRSWLDTDVAKVVQSVLAALSGVGISAQMKLRLGSKAEKYRKGAKIYGRLLRTTTYYDMMIKCGGSCEEIEKFWEECMRKEEEIPLPKASSCAR